jgi:hypothetical protein
MNITIEHVTQHEDLLHVIHQLLNICDVINNMFLLIHSHTQYLCKSDYYNNKIIL